ncbi:MORN repeat-containing protein [Faecalispora anaeroviscerum]|uniref:MORN repeat-containing protein n=1 Tax=Faecalispora anaeroviscerum TaxID=2991836 RepID=UPI0024B88B30|nr:membrane-binding protein [Faecalispora anaeroviscerum]
MRVSEQEILTIYYKGYSALASLHGTLFEARRDFLGSGKKGKGRISGREDGMQVQVRYALSPGGFVWERSCDRRLTEQVRSIPGGYALSILDENGAVRSRTEYNKEHHLQKAEYYAPGGAVQESLSVLPERPEELMRTHWQENGEQSQTILRACPICMGTVEQTMIDSEVGEPQIIAARLDGDFCYCTEQEYRRRAELQERLRSGVVSSVPVFVPQQDEKSAEHSLSDEPSSVSQEELYAPQQDEPWPGTAILREENSAGEESLPPNPAKAGEIAVSDLLKQIQKMEENLDEIRSDLCVEPENMQDFPKKESTQPDVPKTLCNAMNGQLFHEEVHKNKSSAVRYAVAKCGADGAIRAPGLCACADAHPVPPEAAEEIPRAVKTIIISQTERYHYYGEVLDDQRHGRGRTEMPDGKTAYEGTYSRGRRDGFGAYYYRTGRLCYAGTWKKDRREGVGVGFRPDASGLYAGTWKNDRPGGCGAVIGPDGSVCYAGALENGQRHGMGASFRTKDGTLLVARWKNGTLCGEVTLFSAEGRICYTGQWQNGVRHGIGTAYSSNGQIVFTGRWQNDEPVSGVYYEDGLAVRVLAPEISKEIGGKKKDRKM